MNKYWSVAIDVDRLQRKAGIPYCIIKSYNGCSNYNDGNLDVVVPGPLFEVYERVYKANYVVTEKDRLKSKIYETNKLMLTPNKPGLALIHLHSNAGWHNLEFFSIDRILNGAEVKQVEEYDLTLLNRREEGVLCIFHALFEKFECSEDDEKFLNDEDWKAFTSETGIRKGNATNALYGVGVGRWMAFASVWTKYYRAREGMLLWGKSLHLAYVMLRILRAVRSRTGL